MKSLSCLAFALFFLTAVGCSSNSNTVTPPANGGMTAEQIQENQVEVREETFGRPMESEGQAPDPQ
jgi:hypothetical protein